MKIITLTLNPAFDMHCKTKDFKLGHESFFDVVSFESGGKGINITRALLANGVNNTAIVVVGKDNGNEFCAKLDKDNVKYQPIFVDGRIRENIILHDESSVETRVSFNGFEVRSDLFQQVIEKIGEIDENTVITLTGSNPKGISMVEVKDFVKKIKSKGAKVVIDSRSFTLNDLIELKPFLIKPNQDEIGKYFGKEVKTVDEAKEIAKSLHNNGIENAMISLGKLGAVLSTDEGTFYIPSPKIEAVSTIGAGDSSIAGFIKTYIENKSGYECLKTAVAFGSSACLTDGTTPPKPKTIQEMIAKIQ